MAGARQRGKDIARYFGATPESPEQGSRESADSENLAASAIFVTVGLLLSWLVADLIGADGFLGKLLVVAAVALALGLLLRLAASLRASRR